MIETGTQTVTTSEKVGATGIVVPNGKIPDSICSTIEVPVPRRDEKIPLDEATDTYSFSRRYTSFTTRRDVTSLLAQCINMKVHYKWLYNSYWCATLPQLMTRLTKDEVFETLIQDGTTLAALEQASSHMEVAYELDAPMIICVLIMYHLTMSTPILKVRTEAALKTFITSNNDLSDLITDAEKNRGSIVYDNSFDLDTGSLTGLTRFTLLSSENRSTEAWSELTDYMITVWEASNFGASSPEEAVSKWRTLAQEKDEYVETFLSREQQAWRTVLSVCNFYSVNAPDEQERISQVMGAVKRCHSESVTARWRKDMVSPAELKYQNVVSALVKEEARYFTWFPWEVDANQKDSYHRSSKRGKGSMRRNSAPSRSEVENKPRKLCPHCNRLSSHDPQNCWRNPECTSVPDWFRRRYLSKQSSSEGAMATYGTNDHPTAVENPPAQTGGAWKGGTKPVYATLTSDDPPHCSDQGDVLSALGFDVHIGHSSVQALRGPLIPITVAVDTLSVPNLIDKRLVDLHPEWEKISPSGSDSFVSSSGHPLGTFGLYKIGLYLDKDDLDVGVIITAFAVDMDHFCFNARMVLGSNSMEKMGASICWSTSTLRITHCGLTVDLKQLRRGRASPVYGITEGSPEPGETAPSCHPFDEIETRFLNAPDHEIEAFCLKQLEGRELPVLAFDLKPGTHPYQADRSYTVPSGLKEATDRAINNEISKGHWYEIAEDDLEPDCWISPAFVKKKNREIDGLPEVRVLVDLRLLNAAIHIDQHLREGQLIPNQERFIRCIPRCTRQYSIVDVSAAFHGCKVLERCQKWLTFRLNGRLLRSRSCSQGLGLSALFWGRHLHTSLSYVYGVHWKLWMALFVDDFLVHAETVRRCHLRRRLVTIALRCMRKEISSKISSEITPSVTAIGLYFDGPSYRVSDENLSKLRSLFEHEPKNSTEVKRLIGSINWASTAFRGDTFSALGDELRILNDIATMKKFSWRDTPGPEAVRKLLNMMTTENLALHGDLDEVNGCRGGYSWVVQTDASGYAAGGALYRAETEALFDPKNAGNPEARLEGASLVSIWSKALSGSQQRWHTVEKEAYAIYCSVKKWMRLWISTTSAVTDREKLGPSILIWADSTTAIRQWQTFKVPHDPAASLKAKRFISWSENIATLNFLDHALEHVPGARNTIADMLSRLGEGYASQSLTTKTTVDPTYATLLDTRPKLRPSFDMDTWLLDKVIAAYSEDESNWQGVTIAEIYMFLTRPDDGAQARNTTIKSWSDAGLFIISDQGLLFTAAVYAGTRSDYVLVVPVDCEANLIDTDFADMYENTNYLRGQLLFRSHDMLLSGATHMSVGASMNLIGESVWWPGMMNDMKKHVSECPVCSTSTRRLRKQVPGRAPPPHGRFQELQIDHKELPPTLKARLQGAHESGAVLSMVDRLTGELAVEYVKNKTALVTAQTVVRRWFCKRGVCSKLSSDNGSAFVSDVSKVLSAILGYRLKFACVYHPQGSANVERANSAVSNALMFVNESGDCEDIGDLEMHLASAEFAYNYNSGVFRRLFGEDVPTPLTRRQGSNEEGEIIHLSDAGETKLIKMVTDLTNDYTNEHSAESAMKGHYNLFNRVADVSKKSGTFLSCKVGDIVLYQGIEEIVKEVAYDSYSGRILSVKLESGVKAHPTELSPAGDGRPIMQPALQAQRIALEEDDSQALYDTGEYVLYEISTGDVVLSDRVKKAYMIGCVIDSDMEGVRVQVHDGGEKSRVFLPLWQDESGEIRRSKTSPLNSSPVTRLVPYDAILFKIRLRADFALTSNSRARMNSLSIGDWTDPGVTNC